MFHAGVLLGVFQREEETPGSELSCSHRADRTQSRDESPRAAPGPGMAFVSSPVFQTAPRCLCVSASEMSQWSFLPSWLCFQGSPIPGNRVFRPPPQPTHSFHPGALRWPVLSVVLESQTRERPPAPLRARTQALPRHCCPAGTALTAWHWGRTAPGCQGPLRAGKSSSLAG